MPNGGNGKPAFKQKPFEDYTSASITRIQLAF
jgi:hypothetical protein